jgi:hypothetical protein
MKKTTFITTFSKKGYDNHGKYWIESFLENTNNVNAIIFADFDLQVNDDRIKILNFDEAMPEHKNWIDLFEKLHKDKGQCKLGIVFSYKSFVIMYALSKMSEYVVWLDSDCVFKKNTYDDFAQKVLNNKFISVQVDKVSEKNDWKSEEHVESGIVIFDMDHPDKNKFLNRFEEMYSPESMAKMQEPYDGFVIRRVCKEIDFVDLFPPNYTIKYLDPNQTFIHPEVQQRFIHNIGNKGYLDILTNSI